MTSSNEREADSDFQTISSDDEEPPMNESNESGEPGPAAKVPRLSKTRPFTNLVYEWYGKSEGGRYECTVCSKSIAASRSPSNLVNHLKKHDTAYKEYLTKKSASATPTDSQLKKSKKSVASKTPNKTIVDSFREAREKKDGFQKNSEKYNEAINSVAVAFAGNSLPYRLIEDPLFRKMLSKISEGRLQVFPNRHELSSKVDSFKTEYKSAIKRSLENSKQLTLAIDLWTRPGFSSSTMGITCHYFDRARGQLMRILLASRQIPHPHTASKIFELYTKIMEEWGIEDDRVFRILTDNGSNVVSAFK